MERLVIYRTPYTWEGAVEVTAGRWPFKKIEHAPVTSALTAEERKVKNERTSNYPRASRSA